MGSLAKDVLEYKECEKKQREDYIKSSRANEKENIENTVEIIKETIFQAFKKAKIANGYGKNAIFKRNFIKQNLIALEFRLYLLYGEKDKYTPVSFYSQYTTNDYSGEREFEYFVLQTNDFQTNCLVLDKLIYVIKDEFMYCSEEYIYKKQYHIDDYYKQIEDKYISPGFIYIKDFGEITNRWNNINAKQMLKEYDEMNKHSYSKSDCLKLRLVLLMP